MTTATELIQSAFREGNLIPIATQPTANELAEALPRLNSYIRGVFGQEMGEELSDWEVPQPQRTAPVAANFPQLPYPQSSDILILSSPSAGDALQDIYLYPPKNSRIVFGSVAATVYFPESPNDGSRMALVQGSGAGDGGVPGATLTLDGNGRTIEAADTQSYAAPVTARQWLYRADLGDWVAVTTLAADDTCPFPIEFDDLWITALAIRLCPRYGKSATPETQAAFTQAMKHLKTRYRQAGTTTFGSDQFPRSSQSYISGNWWM